jgi:hypothetical protein
VSSHTLCGGASELKSNTFLKYASKSLDRSLADFGLLSDKDGALLKNPSICQCVGVPPQFAECLVALPKNLDEAVQTDLGCLQAER